MWPSVVFMDIRLKMWTGMWKKYDKKMPSKWVPWEKMFPFFLSHLLALISRRNVGTRGHLRKEIVLLKYQYFRFRTKTGAHFELLNWLEKSEKHKAFDVGGLWHCSFYHLLGQFKNSETCITRKSGDWKPLLVHLPSSPIPAFPCLTCTQQLMTKAGVRFRMLWRLYKFKI